MNKIRQDAEDKLKELDRVLRSDDPVLSEHCKSHYFHKDDLYNIKQLERVKIDTHNTI